jgi:hypothetical protein
MQYFQTTPLTLHCTPPSCSAKTLSLYSKGHILPSIHRADACFVSGCGDGFSLIYSLSGPATLVTKVMNVQPSTLESGIEN